MIHLVSSCSMTPHPWHSHFATQEQDYWQYWCHLAQLPRPPSLSPYLPGVAQAYLSLFKTHQFLRFQIQKSTNDVMNPQPFTLTIVQDSTRPFSRRTPLKIQENFQPPSHSTQLPAECQGLLTSETQHDSCSGIIWYPIFLHPMDSWMYPDASQCAQSQG